jgi:hypothetical protein
VSSRRATSATTTSTARSSSIVSIVAVMGHTMPQAWAPSSGPLSLSPPALTRRSIPQSSQCNPRVVDHARR